MPKIYSDVHKIVDVMGTKVVFVNNVAEVDDKIAEILLSPALSNGGFDYRPHVPEPSVTSAPADTRETSDSGKESGGKKSAKKNE